MKKPKSRIDPNKVKTRDPLMVKVINGATKAGTHKDRKRENNRLEARRFRQDQEDE